MELVYRRLAGEGARASSLQESLARDGQAVPQDRMAGVLANCCFPRDWPSPQELVGRPGDRWVLAVANYFEQGVFPDIWKLSHITAIWKGLKSDKNMYRPLSLLPTLSKICEAIIHNDLLRHCQENNVISTKQAAYLKGDSTINQLIYILHKIRLSWTKGCITHGIFLDVSAAFDRVWHKGLIAN